MKTSNNIKNGNASYTDDAKYIMMLCKEKPDIVIKTDFGIGKYKFIKFN